MVIAVTANAHRMERFLKNWAQASEDLFLQTGDLLRERKILFRELLQTASQELQVLDGQVAHRLVERALIKRVERLRGEIFIFRVRGQREMHFPSAAPKQASQFQVSADQPGDLVRNF